jgi:hypothetical protein
VSLEDYPVEHGKLANNLVLVYTFKCSHEPVLWRDSWHRACGFLTGVQRGDTLKRISRCQLRPTGNFQQQNDSGGELDVSGTGLGHRS